LIWCCLKLSAGTAVGAAGSVGASVEMELELVLETELVVGSLLMLELEGARVRVNQNEAWPWCLSRGWIWCCLEVGAAFCVGVCGLELVM
jgi:hypothetical protein